MGAHERGPPAPYGGARDPARGGSRLRRRDRRRAGLDPHAGRFHSDRDRARMLALFAEAREAVRAPRCCHALTLIPLLSHCLRASAALGPPGSRSRVPPSGGSGHRRCATRPRVSSIVSAPSSVATGRPVALTRSSTGWPSVRSSSASRSLHGRHPQPIQPERRPALAVDGAAARGTCPPPARARRPRSASRPSTLATMRASAGLVGGTRGTAAAPASPIRPGRCSSRGPAPAPRPPCPGHRCASVPGRRSSRRKPADQPVPTRERPTRGLLVRRQLRHDRAPGLDDAVRERPVRSG